MSIDWIKELIEAEQKMEESGIVDVAPTFDHQRNLESESITLLNRLKDIFIDHSAIYNKMRGASVGGVKIYGISKTQADFMLFRNGFKLFFSMKRPGVIASQVHYYGTDVLSPQNTAVDSMAQEDLIEARLGAFDEVIWTYQEQPVNLEYLGKYYFTRFIKASAK